MEKKIVTVKLTVELVERHRRQVRGLATRRNSKEAKPLYGQRSKEPRARA